MTKDVLLSISGLHYEVSGNADDYEDNEEMEDDLQEELEDDGDHILNDEDILDDEDKM